MFKKPDSGTLTCNAESALAAYDRFFLERFSFVFSLVYLDWTMQPLDYRGMNGGVYVRT